MTLLTHPNSPLAQAAGQPALKLGRSARQLSPRDREELDRVMNEKYETIDHEYFDLPEEDAERIIFDEAPPIPVPDVAWYHPVMDSFSDLRATRTTAARCC